MTPAKVVSAYALLVMNKSRFRANFKRFVIAGFCCFGIFTSWISPVAASQDATVIEWLQFAVPEDEQAVFIKKEVEIWEPINRRSPEYLGKDIWQDSQNPDHLVMLNRWSGENHKQTITSEMIQQAEAQFEKAVGKSYPIIDSKTFYHLSAPSNGDRYTEKNRGLHHDFEHDQ